MSKPSNTEEFIFKPAVRRSVKLVIGISGPMGAGKTVSALRLAAGIKAVTGEEIGVIDTEGDRSTLDADRFAFKHATLTPPFSPERYHAAFDAARAQGIGIVIIDSMTDEHDGEGGVLEMHAEEVERMSGGDRKKAERVKFGAWNVAKHGRKRFANALIRSDIHVIMCFRADEKLGLSKGTKPVNLGWMPIAGKCYPRLCQLFASLHPGAAGRPTWKPYEVGEQTMVRLPEYFKAMIRDGVQLDEKLGTELAKWAVGDAGVSQPAPQPTKAPKTSYIARSIITATKTSDIAKRIIAAYKPYGVTEDDLRTWLSGPVGAVSDDVVEELREMLSQIKAGKSHPADFFPRLRDIVDDGPPPDDAPHPAGAGA